MKEKDKFLAAIRTLMWSWGGDTPPDAVWAANEMIEWAEAEYGIKIDRRFAEVTEPEYENNEDVIDELASKL